METWPVGEEFSLRPHTQRITLAVIMRAVFGVHDEQRLARFEGLIDTFTARVGMVTSLPPLRRDFGPGSPWRRFVAARENLDAFIYEEIRLRRAEPGREERDDVLSLLMGARDEDGGLMSDAELRDELVTVLAAGHETTATGLAWAVERLLRSPEVLARLRDSLAAGEDEYLEATIRETLRARPVLVNVARRLAAPLEIDGYELKAGTYVMAAIAALHYREDLFPEPESFRPERFLDGPAPTARLDSLRRRCRRCIGASFAEYEMRIVLREIVTRAQLRAPSAEPEKVRIRNITLVPAKGTRIALERPLAYKVAAGLGLLLGGLPLLIESFHRRSLASAWRFARPLDPAGAGPGLGVGELVLPACEAPPRPFSSAAPASPPCAPLSAPAWWRCTCCRPRRSGF